MSILSGVQIHHKTHSGGAEDARNRGHTPRHARHTTTESWHPALQSRPCLHDTHFTLYTTLLYLLYTTLARDASLRVSFV